MSTARRVVVTGIGTVLAERVEAPSLFDASAFPCGDAAEVRAFDPAPYFRSPKALKLAHRVTRFAVAAAAIALADAGLTGPHDELGVVLGTSGSDLQVADLARVVAGDGQLRAIADLPYFGRRAVTDLNPLWLLVGLPNMPSSHVAIQLEAHGPNSTIMTDWIAGIQAIGEASDWIAAGQAPAVLAGGADSALNPFAYAAFERDGIFDRDGADRFIPGEGAAVLLLEDRAQALARGARVHAEVLACASGRSPAATRAAVEARLQACARRAPRRTAPQQAGRLGHALAAAGAIDVALAMRCATSPAVVICESAGLSGQAATLAFATPALGQEART